MRAYLKYHSKVGGICSFDDNYYEADVTIYMNVNLKDVDMLESYFQELRKTPPRLTIEELAIKIFKEARALGFDVFKVELCADGVRHRKLCAIVES